MSASAFATWTARLRASAQRLGPTSALVPLATAAHGRAVNVKKGQFLAPEKMELAAQKVRESGNPNVLLTDRGTTFGYERLVNDMTWLAVMRRFAPVVFDATHSVQHPGAGGAVTGDELSERFEGGGGTVDGPAVDASAAPRQR